MAELAAQMPLADSDVPALVVFDRNGTEPPRGSWFDADYATEAKAGAAVMGAQIIAVKGAEVMALANRVPKGWVFSSGKLFMPRIQKEVYEQLQGHVPKEDRKPQLELVASGEGKSEADGGASGSSPSSLGLKGTLPSEWSKIGVGSLVLTRDIEEDDEAFYLAVVVGKAGPTSFQLKWRDYPDLAPVTRDARQLAMLHPKTDLAEIEWDAEE
ncbi:MAG: hypothetical protein N4A65_09305 [Cohaesibacter sp.]|nr:hypothetical protein [Cohaesibacter sp.]